LGPLNQTPPPKSPKLSTPLLAGVIIAIAALVSGFVFIKVQGLKSQAKDLTTTQLKNFDQLEDNYSDIVKTYSEPATENELLKINPQDQNDIQVLGLEDSSQIQQSRKIGGLYREATNHLENIAKTNNSWQQTNRSPLFFLSGIDPKDLVQRTTDFSESSQHLITFLSDINSLEIEAITMGFEIGTAIQEVVIRNADQTSVDSLEQKVNNLKNLKDSFASVNVDNLSDDIRQDFQASLDSFEEDVSVFTEIVNAARNQNNSAFRNAISSLIIQGGTSSESSIVATVTFWETDPTIQSTYSLHKDWQDFSEATF